MNKVAFITGITGQDGAYLTELLLSKGYDIHGLVRWDSYVSRDDGVLRLRDLGLLDNVTLHQGDLTDTHSIAAIIKAVQPDEIYNLGAMSHVAVSFETPASVFDINTKGLLAVLEAVRLLDMVDTVKVYQASSSEMFGSSVPPQNENTAMHPCSPYGAAKLAAYWLAKTYRDSYGIYVSNGILFNHESPYRGEDFVTHKITRAVAEFKAGGRDTPLCLGNLDSRRDWGHARDYVRGMWMMVQKDTADDYVLATGVCVSVRDFVTRVFSQIGVCVTWRGQGVDEVGVDQDTGQVLVRVSPDLFRPKDVNHLLGDYKKARDLLGWKPEFSLDDLISDMLEFDYRDLGVFDDVRVNRLREKK